MTGHMDLGEPVAHMPGLREGDGTFSVGSRPPADSIIEISRSGWFWRWEFRRLSRRLDRETIDLGYALTRERAIRAGKRSVLRERNRAASIERFSA